MARDFRAYRFAANYGHLEVLKHLEDIIQHQQELRKIISYNNYKTYRLAAENKHYPILDHLETHMKGLPDAFFHMMKASDFISYQQAAASGDLQKLKYLESQIDKSCHRIMIESANFKVFKLAMDNDQVEVCKHLISKSAACFDYAVQCVTRARSTSHHASTFKCQPILKSVIPEKLESLHQEMLIKRPEFDIRDPEQAQYYYSILKFLIQQNQPELDKEITLLISIPAIRALAKAQNQIITSSCKGRYSYHDEFLIKFAMRSNNDNAVVALLASLCPISENQRTALSEDQIFFRCAL